MTAGYDALQGITMDYRTCSLTRPSPNSFSWSILHKRVARGLQGVPRGYGVFHGVTGDYKGLQWVTRGTKGLRGVTGGYKG